LWQVPQHSIIKQHWPFGQLQEVANLIISEANINDTVIAIGMPSRRIQFYTEKARSDLIHLDNLSFIKRQNSQTLPAELTGGWYVLHNPYFAPTIPDRWHRAVSYNEFFDIVVVHNPDTCKFKDCVKEITTLLVEISEANPNSRLLETTEDVLSGLGPYLAD
jgi:hypothetical protein